MLVRCHLSLQTLASLLILLQTCAAQSPSTSLPQEIKDTSADAQIVGDTTLSANHETYNVSLQTVPNLSSHRFDSFAGTRIGNQVKWYVDGCSYFWALSEALEQAKETIWIQGWWVSPELYLRRPPSKFQQYRLDRMLKAAADRGVQVRIVVYKEVTEVFTLDSAYTKHYLEKLSPNIVVFRHPDHTPDKQAIWTEFLAALKDMDVSLTTKILIRLPMAALRALFGGSEQTTFFWAHHEKLCIIDKKVGYLGGLDMSFGRWDTNDHPTADMHEDPGRTVWPGQDYNNARVMDFQNVAQWQKNSLDRRYTPRMGWSDMSMAVMGPAVQDLNSHFVQRWNWIYKQKYMGRGKPLAEATSPNSITASLPLPGIKTRKKHKHTSHKEPSKPSNPVKHGRPTAPDSSSDGGALPCLGCPKGTFIGPMKVQVLRSAGLWSTGVISTEHSIMNAYINTIKHSKHFVYIENQFFITSVADKNKKPVKNKIGKAIVERIIHAKKMNQAYQVIIVMPAIPAFAGDLRSDEALSARAVMEFQYYSIIRGGSSIYETLKAAGIDPKQYIRFFNLRSYDRINTNVATKRFQSRRSHGRSFTDANGTAPLGVADEATSYKLARLGSGSNWDSITACYMTPRTSLFNIPWTGTPEAELDAFVSEQLYVHTKLLIADDKIVIAGSANLNDRSQMGDRDSEIALYIEDPMPARSLMNGKPYIASRFAASLRRFVTRKHLGLVPVQDYQTSAPAFRPPSAHTPNDYDWGSAEDKMVMDPLGKTFVSLWQDTAKKNTEAFNKVFRPVPADNIQTWKEYDQYYQRFYPQITPQQLSKWFTKASKDGHSVIPKQLSTWKWGHVVAEEFPNGVKEMKGVLNAVRGNIVEMPVQFLVKEDIAKWGLILNPGTEQIYT